MSPAWWKEAVSAAKWSVYQGVSYAFAIYWSEVKLAAKISYNWLYKWSHSFFEVDILYMCISS